MPIEITEFESEIVEKRPFRYKRFSQRGRKLHFDYPHELELFNEYNAVHTEYIEIQGIRYEPVHSDNLYRIKQGEKPIWRNKKLYLPVRKELKP